MKIAIIGTHGTGKTTLAKNLFDKIYSEGRSIGLKISFLDETARLCPLPINEEATKEAQRWIISTQYSRELEVQNKDDILICDRGIIDGYVYYNNKFGECKWAEELVNEHIRTYDLLLRTPINNKYLIDDGKRSVNKKFQKEIDQTMNLLLKKFNIPHLEHESLNKTLDIIYKKWRDLKNE